MSPWLPLLYVLNSEDRFYNNKGENHLKMFAKKANHSISCKVGFINSFRKRALLHFHFFFHINFFSFHVVELVLKQSQLLAGNNLHSESILQLPLTFQGDKTLIDISSHIRMNMKLELLNAQFIDLIINFTLQSIGEQNGRLDGTFTKTGRTRLSCIDIHCRTHPLTGNLHQSEFTKW